MYKSLSKNLIVGLLILGAEVAFAQMAFVDGNFQPYDQVSVKQDGLSRSIKNRVLFFAHYTCPYCRKAHDYLPDWAEQLPPPYEFEVVPAVGLNEHIPMAIAYYVVLQARPSRIEDYQFELYKQLQDNRRDAMSPEVYWNAAGKVGISKKEFSSVAAMESTKMFVERAKILTERFVIDEVPTVIVANRYKTSPGRVYNEQQAFVSVMNGLISLVHQGNNQ